MKNNYMKFQKVVFIIFLVAASLVTVMSFGMVQYGWRILQPDGQINFYTIATGLNGNSQVFTNSNEAIKFYNGLWAEIQNVNNVVFWTGVVGLILAGVSAIIGNYSRRRFYLSNLIVAGVTCLISTFMSIVSIVLVGKLIADFNIARRDFEYYQSLKETNPPINGAGLPIYIVVCVLFIAASVLFAVFAVKKWRNTWPRFEQKLELEEEEVSNE